MLQHSKVIVKIIKINCKIIKLMEENEIYSEISCAIYV